MNARQPDALLDWSACNQRWLVQRLAALRATLALRLQGVPLPARSEPADIDEGEGERPAAAADFVSALDHCAAVFALSPFERELLLLLVGAEVDDGLRLLLAEHAPEGPSFVQALAWLDGGHWDAMAPQSPLRHWSLLQLPPGQLPAHAPLAVDERVLHFVCGVAASPPQLDGLARWADAAPLADEALASRLSARLARPAGDPTAAPPRLLLGGDAVAAVRHDTAVAAIVAAGARPAVMALDELPADAGERALLARLVDREAALVNAVLVLHGEAEAAADVQRRALAWLGTLNAGAVVCAPLAAGVLRESALPWQRFTMQRADAAGPVLPPHWQEALRVARQQFQVGPHELAQALHAVALQDADADPADTLWQALRESARGGLDLLAQRIDADTRFDDLVLPAGTLAQLRAIAAQLRQRHRVHDDWGFARRGARGLGIAALFAGESGTGKTLAAEAIAHEAGLDLYRIDLAGTVSKYIGETEKNLARIFDAAEASGAVLLFDEADALFGKRSEVKDSHDRYANIEIAYLLQRIESYRGLAILTSNQKSALDRAFLRRLRFVVSFPFPDEAARAELWRRQFPPAAPVDGVDIGALAALQLAGGHIRGIALNAAFAAAARGQAITQALLLDAARAEFAKLERPLPAGVGA
ncbi:MAG: ATP-binding protein [Rubrivivax sp.]|nr:ATP-binding protein [Rubrivivax sp.]